MLLVLAGLLAMVLLGTTRFDGRWLHPLLACVPVLGFGWLVRAPPLVGLAHRSGCADAGAAGR